MKKHPSPLPKNRKLKGDFSDMHPLANSLYRVAISAPNWLIVSVLIIRNVTSVCQRKDCIYWQTTHLAVNVATKRAALDKRLEVG